MIILIECIVACIIFTIPIIILSRNPLAGIYDYPPAIIQKVRELGLIDDTQLPKSKKVIIKKSVAALIISFLCALLVYYVNDASTFWQGFGYTYLIWTIVDWYDAFIIDCLWFCHEKKFVIPGTEGMKEYKDYWFHIKGSCKGMLIGLPVALLVGVFVALLA